MNALILQELNQHARRPGLADELSAARQKFAAHGFATASFLVPPSIKEAVSGDVLSLIEESGVRRDLRFKETGGTPRRMRNVTRAEIAERSSVIPALYESEALVGLLSEIVDEPVLACPYEPEQYVITRLEHNGDTHGWHWDDYSFALVWVVECPPAEHGGFVQCVPGTTWNKQDPAIHRAFLGNPTLSFEVRAGDLYVMRTNTTLHRVYPISAGVRTIINMGYAAKSDLETVLTHETMDTLWADSGKA
ncbi:MULTISPECIES: HalD/BesD family halogenase [unclassified Nonomuraea]|uniref:HalD/BesD family halogenase n=1 Tax=Nonomuraea sp. NPDC003804 TaxID=3154547 RepID=UPI0033A8119D